MVKDLTKYSTPIAIVLAGLIVAGAIVFVDLRKEKETSLSQEKTLAQQIGEKALDYVNKNILRGGMKASLIEAVEDKEMRLVKMKLKIGEDEFDSYATLDGKYLFPQVFNMEEEKEEGTKVSKTPSTPEGKSCEELKKTDKPLLEAFVVSKCPFGTQMQRILLEIVKNIPQLEENIKVSYLGSISEGKITAMHGEEEAQENLREICLREEQKDKFWEYLSCHIKKGKVEECLKEAKVDEKKLEKCMSDSSRGLKYAKEDFEAQDKYKAFGSPTLVLNGEREGVSEFTFGGRTAEAVKTLICCGFKEKPQFCEKKLDTRRAATGFSEEYASGSSSAGGCR